MEKTKVGILYICTGKYAVFWDNFHRSAEDLFLTDNDIEKHYFVFTDSTSIREEANIHVYFKSPEGFPLDSLKRFEMFLSIQEDLRDMDFVFFLNANMHFVQKVGKEILPLDSPVGLVGALHPGYYDSPKEDLPYERNPDSTAFIPYVKGYPYKYFMGGFNGGSTQQFMELCYRCQANIDEDSKNNIMACFHDESHINAYFFQKDILVLPATYGYPEDLEAPFDPKVIILNKAKHYGDYFIKEYANPFLLPSPFEDEGIIQKAKIKGQKIVARVKKLFKK